MKKSLHYKRILLMIAVILLAACFLHSTAFGESEAAEISAYENDDSDVMMTATEEESGQPSEEAVTENLNEVGPSEDGVYEEQTDSTDHDTGETTEEVTEPAVSGEETEQSMEEEADDPTIDDGNTEQGDAVVPGDGEDPSDGQQDVDNDGSSEEEPAETGIVLGEDGKFYDNGVLMEFCWIEYEGKRYFAKPGGELYKNQFICLYGKDYYYMGADGSVQTGAINTPVGMIFYEENGEITDRTAWIDHDNKRYFSKGEGKLYNNQFICLYGKDYYYMGSDGSMQTGIVNTSGNKLYYAAEDGIIKKDIGWVEYSDKKYFARDGGELFKNQLICLYGKDYYYMGSDGSAQSGLIRTLDNKLYFADEDCLIKTDIGWIDYNGKRYFARSGGELYKDQFICLYGKDYYYMGSDGSVQTGVIKTPVGKVVFIEENGQLTDKTGWLDYNGKRYFIKGDGVLYSNQFICLYGKDYYYMGSDGSVQTGIIRTTDNKLYYAGEDGIVEKNTGWIEYNNKKYFARPGGELYKNQFICLYGTDYYYMGSDGSVQTGIIKASDGNLYYADDNGIVKKGSGWIDYNGKRYFARSGGALYKNQFICLYGTDYYYMGSDGSVTKTPFTVNGYKITPDKNTGKVSKLDYEFSLSDYVYRGYVTYIKVDIATQELRYVKNGRLILYTPVVTGKRGFDTPKGTYYINSKMRNVKLKGQEGNEEWDVTVDYWMGFIGGAYGFHDANWQTYAAGSDRYKNYGSHGCVNLPPSAASKLYSNISVGTIVFIV